MRRSILAAATAVVLAGSLLAAGVSPTAADGRTVPTPAGASTAVPVDAPGDAAGQALAAARRALGLGATSHARRAPERAPARPDARPTARPDATLALRDLFRALPQLGDQDRREAHGLLARPTDGDGDREGDGYTVAAEKKCRNHVCVHWVESTADAPPDEAWVGTTLTFMNKVWRTEVGSLGYRPPVSDRHRGGNGKFDVYLKELGARGLYGYCAPERRAPGEKWLASGYCVLDNDFSQDQYGAPPRDSLRVTAAHEFFHAVQFAYDYGEDPWLMEATATWMEEKVADDVNDNRQYLPYGQLGAPASPLDTLNQEGFNQYGNWLFVEYLAHRFGDGVVRAIWTRAGAYPGSGHQYSTNAVKGVLKTRGGFPGVYRSFAVANVIPARTYREGDKWAGSPATARWSLSADSPRRATTLRINHMSSRNVVVTPDAALEGKRWRLRVVVDG
ncbi:MAG TPA: MXAN_6640 family putative metalloprotease, partial [Nocardioides sp.]|nr:MXAN_6640 family putative metalloprotease [Nocardioides sp.]